MNTNTYNSLEENSSSDEMSPHLGSQSNTMSELFFQKKITRNKIMIKNKKQRFFFPLGVYVVTFNELQSPKIQQKI